MKSLFINFKKAPIILKEYNVGDVVDRENFVSFISLSFAVSRGHVYLQELFFMWTEIMTSFPYATVFNDFVEQGGYLNLSSEERDYLKKKFKMVQAHLNVKDFSSPDHNELIERELFKLNKRDYFWDEGIEVFLKHTNNFEKIKTLSEFTDLFWSKN